MIDTFPYIGYAHLMLPKEKKKVLRGCGFDGSIQMITDDNFIETIIRM
jgi:hypothetical protein